MATPEIFLAYAPRGAGLRCALAYLRSQRDVYGWFTGPGAAADMANVYFVLENFYSSGPTRYLQFGTTDLHSRSGPGEARAHELARMQDAFAHEWLFHPEDANAKAEHEAYAAAELACGEVNLRYERLGKLSKLQPNWTFYSQGFEHPVLKSLGKRWPLEFRLDD